MFDYDLTDSILFKKIYTDTLFKLLYKFFKEMISFIVFLIWQVRFSLNSYGYVFNTPLILFKIIKKGGCLQPPKAEGGHYDRFPKVRKRKFQRGKRNKRFRTEKRDDLIFGRRFTKRPNINIPFTLSKKQNIYKIPFPFSSLSRYRIIAETYKESFT